MVLMCELVEVCLVRRTGGCFQCRVASCTAFVRRETGKTQHRLKQVYERIGAKGTDGGIFGSGVCCSSFFFVLWVLLVVCL